MIPAILAAVGHLGRAGVSPAHILGLTAAAIYAVILLGFVVAHGWRQLRRQGIAFMLIAAGFLYAAATKPDNPTRPVQFPFTDPEQRYLIDNGSVVSNDHVHVNFTPSVVLPSSAMIYLDYIPNGENADAAITYTNATLATFPRPLDFDFVNAISNNWFCYTTWTPGPSVQTNGIAQIMWQLPTSGATNICAMLNTAIYTNNTKVINIEITP